MQQYIDVDRLTIEDAKREYDRLFFTFQQLLCLSEEQASLAVSITAGVCPYCLNNKIGCQCWNDE